MTYFSLKWTRQKQITVTYINKKYDIFRLRDQTYIILIIRPRPLNLRSPSSIVSYCHTNASTVRRSLKTTYSNIFIYKTTVLKFHVEHDLTQRSQNYKIGWGRIPKVAAITKNSKNNKVNFCSRTTGYIWLNVGMEYQ